MFTPDQFVAHRGYTARYPENTLEAVTAAIVAGAVNIEIDIQFSKDGIPVIYHDMTLGRVSGIEGNLFELAADELVRLPAGEQQRLGNRFPDVRISMAADLVTLIRNNPGIHFYVELKEESINHFSMGFCLKALRRLLAPVLPQCTLISFDLEAMRSAKADFGFTSTGIVFREWERRNKLIEATRADIAYINIERIPEGVAIEADCPIVTYEIADIALAAATLGRGAAKIETYAIGELVSALCRTNTMSS